MEQRPALIFLIGVFLPSLVLGWLALRTIGSQQLILERRTAELYQTEINALAASARDALFAQQTEFANRLRQLPTNLPPDDLLTAFSATITPTGAIPFAISRENRVLLPTATTSNPSTVQFLAANRLFLSGESAVEIYQARREAPGESTNSVDSSLALSKSKSPAPDAKERSRIQTAEADLKPSRNVVPQKQSPAPSAAQAPAAPDSSLPIPATLAPEVSDFRTATAGEPTGILARFVNNELQWFVWQSLPEAGDLLLGAMIPADTMRARIANALARTTIPNPDLLLAVLDERGQPIFQLPARFSADWKRPFVAAEIGDAMPFWEATAYLANPATLDAAARAARTTLLALIALALAAIAAAGFFVVRDSRRQLALARQKTDFVSNVSHELKTPLTSIRMFAELLGNGAIDDPARRDRYLRIITLESERLTRLINNVLDFARIEKKSPQLHPVPIDLHPVIERVWDTIQIHLADRDYSTHWTADDPPYPVNADPDALSQVLVNLLSNAEKYGGPARAVELETRKTPDQLIISVHDRGPGVPPGEEKRIFTAFHRAHNSLASGIPGSGLGLTLAARIVAAHGGTLTHTPRPSGGTTFTVTLPLRPTP